MIEHLDILMFVALMAAILSGFPVAFSTAGVAIVMAYIGWATGAMDIGLLGALSQRVFGLLSNQVLIAIPIFVFMGAVLEKSRIAEDLLTTMGRLFGDLRGGLAISVVVVGALLAASTGIVGATVVAMGLIALPAMLRAGYNPSVAAGVVCTAGTLGQIIPPSTLLIILSDVMSNAYQQAQYDQGKFAVEALSVGQFFAAAMLPGLVLVLLYLSYILLRGAVRPADMPADRSEDARPSLVETLRAVTAPILLILAVLGSILGGLASPTEAASVGAVGALLLAGLRFNGAVRLILIGVGCLGLLVIAARVYPVRFQRSDLSQADMIIGLGYVALAIMGGIAVLAAVRAAIRQTIVQEALTSTLTITSMIFATILAAGVFSLVFIGLGGEKRVALILSELPGGPTGALIFCMAFIFVLGFFLDFVEIAVIVLPLIAPPLMLMGHDPIWLGILIAINLQTSFLTPPFGFSLFYLRGAAPPEIKTSHIYWGVFPFIGLQIIGVAIVWLIPQIATWLPRVLY
ncbi:MAG: TRAP transporter large permease subunit [Pseudomonadota bacterium]